MNDINNVDYLNVKIKKEKLTPPRELPKINDKNNENVVNSSKNNNDTNINSADIVDNDKKQIEPVKSSNEILAELFMVFNAPPPEIIINKDDNSGKVEKPKKHKDKKHKKRSSADGKKSKDKDNDKLLTIKKVKKKKRSKDEDKKHQRHNSNHQELDVSSELVEEHQEKDDDHISKKKKRHHHHKEHKRKRKKYDDNDKLINKKELSISKRNNKDKEKVNNKGTTESDSVTTATIKSPQPINLKAITEPEAVKETTAGTTTLSTSTTATATTVLSNTTITTTTTTTTKPNKIIIKCLKNTTIFDASERLAEEKLLNKYSKNESDSNNDEDNDKDSFNGDNNSDKGSDSLSSILSLSDEETYLNEAYNNSKRLAAAATVAGQTSTRLNDSSITNEQSSNFDSYYYAGHNNGCDRNDRYRYSKSYRSKSGERDNYRSSYRSERSRVTDYYDVKKGRWSGESSSRRRKSRSRSYSRSRSRSRSSDCYIDKKKLLDIARKNAINMLKNGTLPGTQNMGADDKEKVLAKMKYNGKTIEELTEYCKKLSNGEKLIELSDVSDGDDSDHDKDGNQRVFNHPFILKDRGPIVMNIKNSTPITPRTAEQTKALLMQYPVSSGQDHRRNENEWIPVLPAKKAEPTIQTVAKQVSKVTPSTNIQQKPINVQNLPPVTYPLMTQKTNVQPPITQQQKLQHQHLQQQEQQKQHMTPLPAPPQIPQVLMTLTQTQAVPSTKEFQAQHQQQMTPQPQNASIFLDNQNQVFPDSSMGANLDVSTIISQRLNAMRKLQENPQDPDAIKLLFDTQKDMSAWATSKFTPGQFIGSTGANILSAKELSAGYQPWAKKDQFTSTTPLSGGMGMHLLQKMGWRPGEGLGKDKTGSLQPLLLEVKLDKKGLVAYEENPNKRNKSKKQQGNNTNNNNNNNNSNILNNNNNNNNNNTNNNNKNSNILNNISNSNNNNNTNNNSNNTNNIITNSNNLNNINNNNNHNNIKNNNNNGTHQMLNNNLPPTLHLGSGSVAINAKIVNTINEKPLLKINNIGTNSIENNANNSTNNNLNGNSSINNNKINNQNLNINSNGNNELMPIPLGNVTIIPNNGNINMNALEEKHPVSLLGELAAKRKWGLPFYEVVLESGPGHSKQFMFKVTVNGIQYQPKAPSNNKKEAKATAAKVCLQHMGILNS